MEYPQEILPRANYKIIDCDLTDYLLIRYTNTNDKNLLIDANTRHISQEHICFPSERIEDLSMSLLGYYRTEHIYIELTTTGKQKFLKDWNPNLNMGIPVFEIEFNLNKNRHYWWIPISKVHNIKFSYKSNDDPHETTCLVRHTPMLWNFWHFSLRWTTEEGELNNMEEKKRKKAARRIGHAVRVLIAQFASIEEPMFDLLSPKSYIR